MRCRPAGAAGRPSECQALAGRQGARPRGRSTWRGGSRPHKRPCWRRSPCARATGPPAARPPTSKTRANGRETPMTSMTFKRASLSYGDTPQPVTPYQRAAQVWDERIGSARVQAHNWRLMAVGSLGLALLLATLLLWLGSARFPPPLILAGPGPGGAPARGPPPPRLKPRR